MKALSRLSLVVCAIVAGGSSPTAAQPSPELFFGVSDPVLEEGLDSSTTASRHFVGMRLEALFGPAGRVDPVRLNLGDHEWVARPERIDEPDVHGFRSWIGAIDGIEFSHVVFTERNGIVSGLINAVSVAYQVRTVAPGIYALDAVDASRAAGRSIQLATEEDARAISAPADVVAGDDGSVIDVLVLYTPAASTDAGGASQLLALASQIISNTNQAFTNSGITPRVRLAATVSFSMTESGRVGRDLQYVAHDPAAQALRDQFRADLVHVLLSNADTEAAGASYVLTDPIASDFIAYSAARVNSASLFEPTRQIAFNLGASVAPEDPPRPGVFSYSHAYKSVERGFRTLQAEPCAPVACPRILYFSNPDGQVGGDPTGSALQNNARTINEVAHAAANWRQEAVSGPGGIPAAPSNVRTQVSGMNVGLLWDAVAGATHYKVQIGTGPGLSNIFDGEVGNITTVSGSLGLGSYSWRVYAVNASGTSPASMETSFSVTTTCGVATSPRNLQASINGQHVLLFWQPPDLGTVTTYVVEAGSSSGGTNLYNGAVGLQPTVQAIVPNGTYYVRVRAFNECGLGTASNEISFVVGVGGAPVAPQDLRLTLTSSLATASWNLAPGAPEPSAFVIEAGSAMGLADLGVFEVSGQFRSVIVPRPLPGLYYVRIKARSGVVVGPPTQDSVLVVP